MSIRWFIIGVIAVLIAGVVFAVRSRDGSVFETTPMPIAESILPVTSSREANHRIGVRPPDEAPIYFENTASAIGVQFRHSSGMSAQRFQPEADGSGAAIFDFDEDGTLDLFLATCVPLPVNPGRDSPHHVLYRRSANGVYEDVTEPSGTLLSSFGQGLAVADYNNDGFVDFYLTNYGPNLLFNNNGDGTFCVVSAQATSTSDRWGTGCAFLDFDEDGDVDIYVANYVQWTTATHPFCGYESRGIRTYCHPGAFKPDRHVLWRNGGDGTFTDATGEAGVLRHEGRGFGVVATDVNGDEHIDMYIANDTSGNFLFLSKGDGTFDDASSVSGAALSGDGAMRASMGVDADDLDGDLLPELFVTNFWLEPNTLFRNQGGGQFIDASDVSGLGSPSRLAMGWGTGLVDLDNDGWIDVLVSNGHIDNNLERRHMAVPYAQRPQLWRNQTGMRFELVSDHAGSYFAEAHVGRALAFGDIDDDGRLDVVANDLDGPAAVLMNRSNNRNRWVRFDLVGTEANRDGIGAIVDINANAMRIRRQVKGGSSYLSAHDLRLLVGVGSAETLSHVSIRWPSGRRVELKGLATNRSYRIREQD